MWKGKSRATDNDFEDLNPVITYRHLLSQALGVKDPLRVIALCDNDAFYAGCEMVRLNLDPSKPLVVSQWDALIAVNYPARKYGISRMDKAKDALKKCPDLLVVHVATYKDGDPTPAYWDNPNTKTHKVSLDHYRRESQKINKKFKELLPASVEIERASIDESFIDFTRPVREKLLQTYPDLARIPPEGADSPLPPPCQVFWDGIGTLIPINPDEGQQREGKEVEVTGQTETSLTWHDVALSFAAEMMQHARDEIREKLGYSTSAGIARNKFLAKLAASYRKPNNQAILRNSAIPNYLKPTAFQKIRMLGGKLGNALATEYEASTVAELLSISLEEMQHKFGEESIWVYEIIRGIDRSEVKEKSFMTKSMAASKNLPKPIMKPSHGGSWIRVLAAELSLRLKDAREISSNLWPRTIALGVRKGYSSSHSKQAPFPFVRNVTTDIVAAAGEKLWKEFFGTSDSANQDINVTHLSLTFGGIETGESNQRGIEGFLTPSSDNTSPRKGFIKRKAEDGSDPDGMHPSANSDDLAKEDAALFLCKRCGKRIELPGSLVGPDIEDDVKQQALAVLKTEHEDYHFAHDLSQLPDDGQGGSLITSTKPKKKRKKSEVEGIAKFFRKP